MELQRANGELNDLRIEKEVSEDRYRQQIGSLEARYKEMEEVVEKSEWKLR